ncbi:uncharacterized protein K489DRAFT_85259 [Dissoconium aciculare CBS 342.82]|uniref:peptidylprolyl isomerase n=1 Tax=Dissoconium aciculare CBS 342.82 TaxID=1314786 RepID=A0A6J3LTM2_9PEZI|nr:uncharacterized protein K489DRAFT_85259 [Dissoconium aciculare CBS 342.82]KAF1818978.1 hypothetical protein K489DRAFT_85259 [Dissoconium aciculare CBS 342.82]
MTSASLPRVFLDVNIGQESVGRLVIELYTQHAPRTAENFRQLCTGEYNGLSYAKIPFHRVIDEFMIQGGDIEKSDGTGVTSIYGGEFEDENLNWRELDAAGLVCSANRGKDTNGSQFFISLVPTPHLNGKHTVFGRVVSGEAVLERIAKVDVDDNDHPLGSVLIARSGELERKKKAVALPAEHVPASSKDRGRRRKSDQDLSESEMIEDGPAKNHRARRRSDLIVDEGIRGRPRLRSSSQASHASSQPLSDGDEPLEPSRSTETQKRKRSQSPARHGERRTNRSHEDPRRTPPRRYESERDHDRYRPSPRSHRHQYAGHRVDKDRDRYRDRDRDRRDRHGDDGRLGNNDGRLGNDGYGESEAPVQFKGRGAMKYRETRAW